MAGVTLTGFEIKTYEEILADIHAALRAAFGTSIDLSDSSVLGQIAAIVAERYAELWEVGQATYSAFDPDQAEGAALEAVCAITGTTREEDTPSTVVLTLTGTPGTALSIGDQVSETTAGKRFALDNAFVLSAATAWAITTAYVVGDLRTNSGNIYRCTVSGTSAGAGGPSGTGTAIVDNTVTWRFLGVGTGLATLQPATATEDGPNAAVAYTVTVIETPVAGWSGVTNIEDAVPGTILETDPALRVRREDDLSTSEGGPLAAVYDRLSRVTGVTSVTIFQNTSDVTVDGIPPHQVEALVEGGDDQAIFQALFDSVGAGIGTHGTEVGTVTFSPDGGVTTFGYQVKFSRPTIIDVYAELDVTYDPDTFPADGEDQIIAAIVARGDARGIGYDAKASMASAAAWSITGVLDVTASDVDTTASPSGTTVTIGTRERADWDTARVVVNLTPGAP